MHQLYLEDLKVGDKWVSREESINLEEIKEFANSFDPQPYHIDEIRAKNTFFGQLVASGWQTAGITMRLMVESIPIATGLIGAAAQISWPKPTYPGDTLRVEAEVIEIKSSRSKPDRGMVVVEIKTFNQHNEVVQLFTCTMLAFRRSSGIPPLNNELVVGHQ
ncbi:MaoC family dehydratase [Psychrobacter sp.]|uniref:MaoC family dehydratase n=1 Tax=Psychrobacter sp. TaxID=56811 RepID=UPI0025DBD327|nr:MaoC family dehydratase [Psychrobacter sp.]